jgi:hypothetical protein
VPLLAIMSEEARMFSEAVPATAALICFLGGFVRMLYALLFQDGPLRRRPLPAAAPLFAPAAPPASALWSQQRDAAALPPAQPAPPARYTPPQRLNTAEIYQPPSVVDHTTRHLRAEPETPPERER